SWKDNEKHTITYNELYNSILNYSSAFLEMGLKKGDKVALISDNNPEWISLSLGMNYAGIIDVPRGNDASRQEIDHIVQHSDAKAVILENKKSKEIFDRSSQENIRHVISIDDFADESVDFNIKELNADKTSARVPEVDGEDIATIIYTSGTTGMPKGVMLTHHNFISNAHMCVDLLRNNENDKLLSFLPAWHVFERMAKYVSLLGGSESFYTTQKNLMNDISEQHPTVFPSVPRVWELVYSKLTKKLENSNYLEKAIFQMFKSRIMAKKLGGKFKFAISGGGALPDYVDQFFNKINVKILEGYGMTETSPVITARTPENYTVGNVGKPLNGVTIKILDEVSGENVKEGIEGIIHASGPNVMKGYYKDPEATSEVISVDENGKRWINTGDLGYIRKDGNLKITGRAKEMIVLANGENINPNTIENTLQKSKYIISAFITGQDKVDLCALIEPDKENLVDFCKENNIQVSENSYADVLKDERVRELYSNEIRKYINKEAGFKIHETIARNKFELLENPFEVGKELTPTLKFKRRKIETEYHKDTIENMYQR
ncbi:MAG: AMP-dependent synthetase/ligase, partial [Nanoarchaeota archaeon]